MSAAAARRWCMQPEAAPNSWLQAPAKRGHVRQTGEPDEARDVGPESWTATQTESKTKRRTCESAKHLRHSNSDPVKLSPG